MALRSSRRTLVPPGTMKILGAAGCGAGAAVAGAAAAGAGGGAVATCTASGAAGAGDGVVAGVGEDCAAAARVPASRNAISDVRWVIIGGLRRASIIVPEKDSGQPLTFKAPRGCGRNCKRSTAGALRFGLPERGWGEPDGPG